MTDPLFDSLSPARRPQELTEPSGALTADGVFLIMSRSAAVHFQRCCTYPGCSHRHEDKHHRFDFMLLPARRADWLAARHSGHKP